MAHVQAAAGSFTHKGEHFGQEFGKAAARFVLPAVLHEPQGQSGVLKSLHFRFKLIDPLHDGTALLQIALVFGAEDFFEEVRKHGYSTANDIPQNIEAKRAAPQQKVDNRRFS
jgi:hypothetical protein